MCSLVDRDSHYRDTSNRINLILHLQKPYKFVLPSPKYNQFRVIEKEYFRTKDICKILKITPATFRQRIYNGKYDDNFKRDRRGRLFTYSDLQIFYFQEHEM